MAMELDEIIPNFTLFVLILAPVILLMMFAMNLLVKFFNIKIKPIQTEGDGKTFYEIMAFLPAFYMLFPIWEIAEYILGTRENILDRLFEIHFQNLMFLIVLTGIAQILWAFFKIEKR